MNTYSMKIDNDAIYLKNGAMKAKWAVAIMDEKSGNIFAGQSRAAKKLGVHPTTVGDIISGRKEPGDDLRVRKATADEVRTQFGDRIRDEIKGQKKASKRAGALKAKGKTKRGKKYVGFRVAGAGIEVVTAGGRWEPSSMTAKEARRRGLKEAFRAKGLSPAQEKSPVQAPATSFLAVTWPDGQVTVRAAVGAWSQHFQDVGVVPASVMAAAKVYDLAGV